MVCLKTATRAKRARLRGNIGGSGGDAPVPSGSPLPRNQNYPAKGQYLFRKKNSITPKRRRSGGAKLSHKLESVFNSPMIDPLVTKETRHVIAALASPKEASRRRSRSIPSSQPRSQSLPRAPGPVSRRLSFEEQPRDLADGRFAQQRR